MLNCQRLLRDASATNGSKELEDLPVWDLNDLYSSPKAPELKNDMEWLERECKLFADKYEGKLDSLSSDEMVVCVHRNEKISNVSGRLISFAGLRYYQMTTDEDRSKFFSDIQCNHLRYY